MRHCAFAEQFCNQHRLLHSTESTSRPVSIRMSDALQHTYLSKPRPKTSGSQHASNRAINYLFASVGDKYLMTIREPMPMHLETSSIRRGLVNTSVKRNFEVVRAIFNLAEREHALDVKNPFANVLLLILKQVLFAHL